MDLNESLESLRTVVYDKTIDFREIATGTKRSEDQYVFINDVRLSGGTFPKVFFEVDSSSNNKLNWGGRKDMHMNEERVNVNIHFFNKARFKYLTGSVTYENGGANTSRDLNWYAREQIRNKIVEHAGSLTGMNNIRFGTFSKTESEADLFWGFVPVSFGWVNKIGGN